MGEETEIDSHPLPLGVFAPVAGCTSIWDNMSIGSVIPLSSGSKGIDRLVNTEVTKTRKKYVGKARASGSATYYQ